MRFVLKLISLIWHQHSNTSLAILHLVLTCILFDLVIMWPLNVVWLTTTVFGDCSHMHPLEIGSLEMDVTWCSIIYYSLAAQHQLSIKPEPMVVVKLLVNRRPPVTDENLLMHVSGYLSFLIFSLSVLFCVCGYLFPSLVESDPSVHPFIHQSVEQHDLNALQSSSKYAYNHFKHLDKTHTKTNISVQKCSCVQLSVFDTHLSE